jgi:hypothetical protein
MQPSFPLTITNNLTPTNINKAKSLLQQSNSTEPHSPEWNSIQNELGILLNSMISSPHPSKQERLLYYLSGIYDVVIPIIKANQGKHQNFLLEDAWLLVQRGMIAIDSNDRDNIETIRKGVELGFIELAVEEARFQPLRYQGRLFYRASHCFTETAIYADFTERVLSSGAPLACLEIIKQGGNLQDPILRSNIGTALRTLTGISLYNIEIVKSLPGIVKAVHPYLPLLTRVDDDELDDNELILLGFIAGRLLVRIGKGEGGSKIIEEKQSVLLDFYPFLMRKAMDAGISTNYLVFNSFIKLNGIALDLSIISGSDIPKKSLVSIIPLMIEMMLYHNNNGHNKELIMYGMVFLSQVSEENACLEILIQHRNGIKAIQDMISADRGFDKETLSLLGEVVGKVVFSD